MHVSSKYLGKKLRFINSVSLKLFHNNVTTFKAIYLDFLLYPSFSHSSHILEMLSGENDHQEDTTLLGHLWSSCTKATAKAGICS